MDNSILEWLFFLLFIIASLSSLFKKNKPADKRPYSSPLPENEGTIDRAPEERRMDDPFAELEKIFREQMRGKIPSPGAPEDKPADYNKEYYRKTSAGSDYFGKDKRRFESNNPESYAKKEPVSFRESSSGKKSTEDKVTAIEGYLRSQPDLRVAPIRKPVNKRTEDIRKTLKNHDSFKNLFIMSEILGKPKALRR